MVMKYTPYLPSKSETKAENTTAFAMGFIGDETFAREAKTQRLRTARLEREASEKKSGTPTENHKKSRRTRP